MSQPVYSDEELLRMICGTDPERKAALRQVFLNGHKIAKNSILKNGGQAFDADDAITEAIIVLDRQVRAGRFVPKASLKSYFVAICQRQWLSQKRPTQKISFTDETYAFDGLDAQTPETLVLESEQKQLLQSLLSSEEFGERCRETVRLYGLKYSHAQIAEVLQTTEGYAKQMVFRCKNKLREILEKHPSFMQQLLDTL